MPATATVHSAFGAVMSDLHITVEQSDPMHAANWATAAETLDADRLEENFRRLEAEATAALLESGAATDRITLARFAEVKFRMQAKSLAVPVPEGPVTPASLATLLASFRAQFAATYGDEAVFTDAGVELPSMRVQATGELSKPPITQVVSGGASDDESLPPARQIYMGGDIGYIQATVHRGGALREGDVLDGPAIIEHPGTTIFIGLGQSGRIDYMGNTIISNPEKGAGA